MGTVIVAIVARQLALLGLAALRRPPALGDLSTAGARVDVVIPAYDEAAVIEATIRGAAAALDVGQIIVVDDGSTDDTAARVRALQLEGLQLIIHPINRGKAEALNTGLRHASTPLVATLDADTVPDPLALRALASALGPGVAAAASNVKVGNRDRALTRWQSLEYIAAIHLGRRAQAALGTMVTVPGALAVWDRGAVQAAGGFSGRTLAEDTDLTLTLQRTGHAVRFVDRAVAWTQAPPTLAGLVRQRRRWLYGNLQCGVHHLPALIRGPPALALVGLPELWWTHLGVYLLLPCSVAWLVGAGARGWSPGGLLALGAALFALDLLGVALAVFVDRERPTALIEAPLQRLLMPFVLWGVFAGVVSRVISGVGVRWLPIGRATPAPLTEAGAPGTSPRRAGPPSRTGPR